MDASEVARAIDWTPHFANQFVPTDAEFEAWCRTAVERGIGQILLGPMFISRARKLLAGSEVKIFAPIASALGSQDVTPIKVSMVQTLAELGAQEFDMIMDLYEFGRGNFKGAEEDVRAVVSAAKAIDPGFAVKVIVETGIWTDARLRDACKLVIAGGADFVKTCTGRGPRGVNERDMEIIKDVVAASGSGIKIKASGGIKTGKWAARLLEMGASRLGASDAVAILESL